MYLPEIDGLRFMAVFMVAILMHTTNFIDVKFHNKQLFQSRYWGNFIIEGVNGMYLFFMISGFILSLPFARAYLTNNLSAKPGLKQYYLRRLIRLEPPYIIALAIFFIMNVWVVKKFGFEELLPHFFASLFYLHNIIYSGFSFVLPVAWSLEVEVMFYLIAPFLCFIYLMPFAWIRRLIFIAIITASVIYWHDRWEVRLQHKFLYFFLSGMLITDLYCTNFKLVSSAKWCTAFGVILLLAFFLIPSLYNLPLYVVKHGCLMIFFYIVLTNQYFKNVFSTRIITIIGGMCYSIYLLHFGVLSCVGMLLQKAGLASSNVYYIPLYLLLFAACILGISAAYFILVEKPFMRMRLHRRRQL